ncbi:MAG: hypothetical protein IT464_12685 [Planctomycetes bacterium]|nr:hypothetical protein [Planctomycetota bacterium]
MKPSTKAKIGSEAVMFTAVGYLVGLLLRHVDADVSEANVAAVTGLVLAIVARLGLAFQTKARTEAKAADDAADVETDTVQTVPPSDIDADLDVGPDED